MKSLIKSTITVGIVTSMFMAASVSATDLIFAPGEGDFNWASYEKLKSVDLTGKQVTVSGPFIGSDKAMLESVFAYFEKATGAVVKYNGSDGFEQQIMIDVEAGSAPNIAIFPQPGLAEDMAKRGLLSPLGNKTAAWVKKNYAAGQSWVDLGTFENPKGKNELFGFFYRADLKSLVWYIPENFEDAGYEVPESMEELKMLTAKIAKEGQTPWCIGLGSGSATGWPATDWVEDLLLRTQAPDVYDKWVSNEIPFDDKRIVAAVEEFGSFARNDEYVAGGASAVSSTDYRDSPKGLFTSPSQCYMHRQASFIPVFFPEGAVVGEDVDFFYFPAYAEKDLGSPVLGAGTMMAITKQSKAAEELIEFLKTPIAHEVWMAQSGFLTPHKGVNSSIYATDSLRRMGKILLEATTFRFDASDLMPGAIGAGAFWTGMVDYTGGKDADKVTKDIQATWDTLKK